MVTTVELYLFEHYTAPWINSWKKALARHTETSMHQGLPHIWTEDEFYGFLREFLSKAYSQLMDSKPEASHILDKSCGYSFHVEDILRLLPNARFIHMIRDGRDVAASMMAAQKTIGAWGSTVERAARLWKEHVTAARKTEHYGGQYTEVRYEDLILGGPQTLRRVFEFCDLGGSGEEVAAIYKAHEFKKMKKKKQEADERFNRPDDHYRKGVAGSWQTDVNPKQRHAFDEIAGDLVRELGYASDDWWADSRFQYFTLPWRSGIWKRWKFINDGTKVAGKVILGPKLTGYIRAFKQRNRHIWARGSARKLIE